MTKKNKHSDKDFCKCGKEIWEEDCDECYWKCIKQDDGTSNNGDTS